MRSASSATLRREARIKASVSSAGATGELLLPVGDRNAELGAGGEVDRLRIAADQRDQLELRQSLEQRARELHPLADRDDDVGLGQALDQLRKIARRLAIAGDVVMADQRKAVEPIDHVLVVVGNDDLHRMLSPLLTTLHLRLSGERRRRCPLPQGIGSS